VNNTNNFVNVLQLDDPLKDYRLSYFKDGRLTYSYIIRKDTEAFTVMQAAINTRKAGYPDHIKIFGPGTARNPKNICSGRRSNQPPKGS
jgi:hypothetical protein